MNYWNHILLSNKTTINLLSVKCEWKQLGILDEVNYIVHGLNNFLIENKLNQIKNIEKTDPDNTRAVQQDDMLITPGRSALKCTKCLWPKSANGMVVVPYSFSSNYNDWQLNLFKTSMEEFETLTCVRLVPRTTEKDFLNIMSSQGCVAYVGRIGGGQMVGLDSAGCMFRGIIQHEINHALGFYHEHMRSDRDDYVTIMYQYISPGEVSNFNKADTNNLGLEYDYGSVMHYNNFAFSNKSGQPTIVPKPNPNVQIGQRDGISPLDMSKINKLYQCDVCANLLNNNSGSLTSANYPSAYPNNASCVWLIRTPSQQVALNFVAFDVQSSPNCMSDYIRIYNGPTKNYPLLLDRTCGSGLIPPIIGSTNQLLVEFSSDSSVTGVGFNAVYSTVQCGGTFYMPQGSFTSPGYPNNYGANLNCVYTIAAPAGKTISLSFSDFHLEDSPFCIYDNIKWLDGTVSKGPFCGDRNPFVINTKSNTMKLTFHSDEFDQNKGFSASYTFV
ncbi:embryonic protein UVS.2-like [Hyla sarda]|uniref:embryonic protein UVS.2-like n=1 Tax=Hyla sarda TaxID=327740 RepID=UPI0024C2FF4E|nr:embryonic protein UVS.2-like [Hyla sarda]